jgi:ABC-type multidrug transport system ATPase subunit
MAIDPATGHTTPLLSAECVSKTYAGRRVLSSATLRAVPGELRVLFGRNGIGKSTLLKIAAGRVTPDNGTVHYAGRGYLSVRHATLATLGLFYLPDHDLLSRAFTVRQQLTMLRAQFRGGDVASAAERVGITAHLDKRPSELSGGELRRAELAAILVRQPRCLLADEPYRGIAPHDADAITSILKTMARAGMAVVITGHEVPTLLHAADHISWCTNGTTYELGPPEVAVQHDQFVRDYLGNRWLGPMNAMS